MCARERKGGKGRECVCVRSKRIRSEIQFQFATRQFGKFQRQISNVTRGKRDGKGKVAGKLERQGEAAGQGKQQKRTGDSVSSSSRLQLNKYLNFAPHCLELYLNCRILCEFLLLLLEIIKFKLY